MAKAQKYEPPLLTALRFVKHAQSASGTDQQTHCMLAMNQLVAFDGVLAAGAPIDEQLTCCPHTHTLIAALERCDEGLTISHVAMDRLVIQSGEFQATIPLYDPQRMQWAVPDAQTYPANDAIKAAIIAAMPLVNEKAERVHEAALLLQANSVAATNGNLVIEAWHGWQLPPNILLPKALAKALKTVQVPLVGIGYGDATVTFWFENKSWIRSQRYLADWPPFNLLSLPTTPETFPRALLDAADKLAPFTMDNSIYCYQGRASSHPFVSDSAFKGQVLENVGIAESRVYPLKTLQAISCFVEQYDERAMRLRTFVYGKQDVKIGAKKKDSTTVLIRGCFAHTTENITHA